MKAMPMRKSIVIGTSMLGLAVAATGAGAAPAGRVPWAKPLSAAEAAGITVEKVLGGADGWQPPATSATGGGPAK